MESSRPRDQTPVPCTCRQTLNHSTTRKSKSEAFMQNRDAFADKLDKELAQEYERLNDAHNVLFSIEEADAYTRGMKLGARLALELLGDDAGRR